MDIAATDSMSVLKNINGFNDYYLKKPGVARSQGIASFDTVLKSAFDMIKTTNDLSNAASEEEMNFALGYTDNVADLMVAQKKANLSLQYVVNIRNTAMSAYREIMNLQF